VFATCSSASMRVRDLPGACQGLCQHDRADATSGASLVAIILLRPVPQHEAVQVPVRHGLVRADSRWCPALEVGPQHLEASAIAILMPLHGVVQGDVLHACEHGQDLTECKRLLGVHRRYPCCSVREPSHMPAAYASTVLTSLAGRRQPTSNTCMYGRCRPAQAALCRRLATLTVSCARFCFTAFEGSTIYKHSCPHPKGRCIWR
jgi:hypothetical protein